MKRTRAMPPVLKASRALERAVADLGDDVRREALAVAFGADALAVRLAAMEVALISVETVLADSTYQASAHCRTIAERTLSAYGR